MKRLLCLILTGPAVFFLIISVFLLGTPAFSASEDAASSSINTAYILSESGGKLALYRTGETAPIAQYEIYTTLLPPSDVALLQKGIPIDSQESLYRYLEDFGA